MRFGPTDMVSLRRWEAGVSVDKEEGQWTQMPGNWEEDPRGSYACSSCFLP